MWEKNHVEHSLSTWFGAILKSSRDVFVVVEMAARAICWRPSNEWQLRLHSNGSMASSSVYSIRETHSVWRKPEIEHRPGRDVDDR